MIFSIMSKSSVSAKFSLINAIRSSAAISAMLGDGTDKFVRGKGGDCSSQVLTGFQLGNTETI